MTKARYDEFQMAKRNRTAFQTLILVKCKENLAGRSLVGDGHCSSEGIIKY